MLAVSNVACASARIQQIERCRCVGRQRSKGKPFFDSQVVKKTGECTGIILQRTLKQYARIDTVRSDDADTIVLLNFFQNLNCILQSPFAEFPRA